MAAAASDCKKRILLVEDDEDTRELMAVALRAHGFVVEDAPGPHEALAALAASPFDLVLTDYDMPVQTGAAMLQEAAHRGLLGSAATLLVTAHPDPAGVDDLEVIRKPVDLDQMLRDIRSVLDRRAGAAPAAAPPPAAEGEVPALEIVLYVSPRSAASRRAQRLLEAILARPDFRDVHVEICDVNEDVARAEADRVVFTPTLVRRRPGPPLWVVGDFTARDLLDDLLRAS